MAHEDTNPPPAQPQVVMQCICGVLVLGVGVVVVVGIKKMCDKIPAPPPPPPPPMPTNTNTPPAKKLTITMPSGTFLETMTLQTSSSLSSGWQDQFNFAFSSEPGALTVVCSDAQGVPIVTNVQPVSIYGTNQYAVFDLQASLPQPPPNAPLRIWRMVSR